MRLSFRKQEDAAWVEWKHGISFHIIPAPLSKMNKIAGKVSKSERFLVRGQRKEKVIDTFNFEKYVNEVADLVDDWKGIEDESSNPLSFDRGILIELLNCYAEPERWDYRPIMDIDRACSDDQRTRCEENEVCFKAPKGRVSECFEKCREVDTSLLGFIVDEARELARRKIELKEEQEKNS